MPIPLSGVTPIRTATLSSMISLLKNNSIILSFELMNFKCLCKYTDNYKLYSVPPSGCKQTLSTLMNKINFFLALTTDLAELAYIFLIFLVINCTFQTNGIKIKH